MGVINRLIYYNLGGTILQSSGVQSDLPEHGMELIRCHRMWQAGSFPLEIEVSIEKSTHSVFSMTSHVTMFADNGGELVACRGPGGELTLQNACY